MNMRVCSLYNIKYERTRKLSSGLVRHTRQPVFYDVPRHTGTASKDNEAHARTHTHLHIAARTQKLVRAGSIAFFTSPWTISSYFSVFSSHIGVLLLRCVFHTHTLRRRRSRLLYIVYIILYILFNCICIIILLLHYSTAVTVELLIRITCTLIFRMFLFFFVGGPRFVH